MTDLYTHGHGRSENDCNCGRACCLLCKGTLKIPKYFFKIVVCLFCMLIIIAIVVTVVYDVNMWETWTKLRETAEEWKERWGGKNNKG